MSHSLTPPQPILWIVIPCYNEGSSNDNCLIKTASQFLGELRSLIDRRQCSTQSRVCYVDDGSSDNTWTLIEELASNEKDIVGLKLTRNHGHQNALLAGLMEAMPHCDVTVSIDCDGQDDISAISDMLNAFKQGYDIIYGVRSSRKTDTTFKRMTAEGFYKLLKTMGAEVIFNHADYRMMSFRALEGLSQFKEVNLFLRGLVPLVGYPSTTVEYERSTRTAGKSNYPLKKMIKLAIDGVTSLSIKPIRIISSMGILFSLVGIVGIIWALISLCAGTNVAGWASTLVLICLIGGLQLLSLGVIGEYIGKIYLETKERPRYLIEKRVFK